MVAYYRAPGPRLGLPRQWLANEGIHWTAFVELARNEGLEPVRIPYYNWTSASLEMALKTHGPIWAAGLWNGFHHVIVLTGVEGDRIYANDPDGPKRLEETLDWFNKYLAWRTPNCMMYHP